MPQPLIFYTNPMSRGQIVRWMLEEVGADYQEKIIEYGEPMKSTEYLAINPMGKVPAIQHGDHIVTECAAICAYLADAFPESNLVPDNKANYYRWLFYAAGPLESAVTNKSMGLEVDEEQGRMVGYGNYDLTIATLDQWLGNNDYICGAKFTAADVYIGSQVDWGIEFKTIPPKQNLVAYAERLRQRLAYIKAKKIDADLIAANS